MGAYNSLGELVGFALSMLGSSSGEPIQHSYMLAVRVAYRNFDVGFKLKMAQRKEALKRKSGARGLRAILERAMLDLMYELPSLKDVQECLINEDFILKHADPILTYGPAEGVSWDKPEAAVQ
jgi:ATP-dependent Clp protease ATP-binding subunit ClpX